MSVEQTRAASCPPSATRIKERKERESRKGRRKTCATLHLHYFFIVVCFVFFSFLFCLLCLKLVIVPSTLPEIFREHARWRGHRRAPAERSALWEIRVPPPPQPRSDGRAVLLSTVGRCNVVNCFLVRQPKLVWL